MVHEDTIAAVATARGAAGVGIIRVSGPAALAIGQRMLRRRRPLPARRMVFGALRGARDEPPLDEGFVCAMPGPRSYTGEDVVELHVHGGLRNLDAVLKAVLELGARAAEAGEFTRRAVLNGRMDLTRAEALLDVIDARSGAGLALAHQQRGGAVSEAVAELAGELDGVLAAVEADLDFPDESETGVDGGGLPAFLTALAARVGGLAATYEQGRLLREGFRVCLVGLPNAGKSTLFNALLGDERAIVTELPGTTRDFLEETVELDGLPLVLVDTAGVREGRDRAEAEGVRRAWRQIDGADLTLLLLDATSDPVPEEEQLRSALAPDRTLALYTKADKPPRREPGGPSELFVSAVSGQGLDDLRRVIQERALPTGQPSSESAVISRRRQRVALDTCAAALRRAAEAGRSQAPLELMAADLRQGRRALDELVGVLTPDELLDRIFGEFCIGK